MIYLFTYFALQVTVIPYSNTTGKIKFPEEHVVHNFTKHFSGTRKSRVNRCLNG